MKLLTVFTPSFNRAYCLDRLYKSLLAQECKDFEWLIVDDGSTDNTKEVVSSWEKEDNGFDIRYVYKENGGLHTGYNVAIENAESELCVCIDSDDMASGDLVKTVKEIWDKIKADDSLAGIIGLDVYDNGKTIGDDLPAVGRLNLWDLAYGKYKIKNGDRKLVIRTELYKEVAPMPSFSGEKNFNPQYMHLKIAAKRDFYVLNKPLCIVEYQDMGMSANIFKQFRNSPNSFIEQRKLFLRREDLPFKKRLKTTIHLISSCIFAKKNAFKECPKHKWLVFFAFPFGVALNLYIRKKAGK